MPVRNIECQLAQGQLNRYLSGGGLSESAVSQLEAHIQECEDCADYLEEKKEELTEVAPAPKRITPTPTAVIEVVEDDEDEEIARPFNFMATLAQKKSALDQAVRPVKGKTTEVTLPPFKTYAKPLLYSLGLAVVMIAMSSIMRDPTKLFGERVSTSNPNAANVAEPEKKGNETKPNPSSPTGTTSSTAEIPNSSATKSTSANLKGTEDTIAATTPTAKPKPVPATGKPKTTNSKPAPATTSRSTTTAKPPTSTARPKAKPRVRAIKPQASKPRARGIKVYDGSGNAIN